MNAENQTNHVEAIDNRVFSTFFSCDLLRCKGACCTFPGGSGPPVAEEEISRLTEAYQALKEELPKEHKSLVDRFGLFERHGEGINLRCYSGRACVFVSYEEQVAVCAIERAYRLGRFNWIKPRSCHLFPVRYDKKGGGFLRYEEFSECEPALKRGENLRVPLAVFIEDALTRVFGGKFALDLINRSYSVHNIDSSRDCR